MGSSARDVEVLSEHLEQELAAAADADARVETIVAHLAGAFGVDVNEVALFRLSEDGSVLRFLWPARLRQVGTIPYSSLDSLAARTAREGAVFLENTFAARRHASAFEKVRLEPGIAPPPKPIRKIISVPVLCDDRIIGVIQVSRKGDADGPEIGDFSDADATLLLTLAGVAGPSL